MRHLTAIAAGLLLAGTTYAETPAAAPADSDTTASARDYSQISLEDLLNRDISVVATKTRVDVMRAPVSVSTLTPEDIRRSGATNIADLLRTVPGIDVLESYPSYISVSSRGTSEVFVNNMLVLIDGRRLESLIAGVPFLEQAPVRLEDIKRIEIVKGPVGALYGTNALAGIISITTFSASEVKGTTASLTGGNRNTYDGTLRQAGSIGQSGWDYKLVGGYSYTGTWAALDKGSTLPQVALRRGDFVALFERPLGRDRQVDVEAGVTTGDTASLTIVTYQNHDFTFPHLRLGYRAPDFHTQLTVNYQKLELTEMIGPVQALRDHSVATNLSIDRTLHPMAHSTVTMGGNFRYQRSDFTSLSGAHDQLVGGVFIQDEQVLVKDRVTFFGAAGLSRHPEIDPQFDGNAALVVSPSKHHAFRASVGRGHRDPSFLENFINFRRQFGPRAGYQSPNTDLKPETMLSWEAGYHGRFDVGTARVSVFAEGFRENFDNLVSIVTTNVAPGTLPQYPTVTVEQQFRNIEDRTGKGFEVGGEVEASSVRFASHYSYQRFVTAGTDTAILRDIPRHKLSAGLRTTAGILELDAWVHWVSKTVEPDGYVLFNPRIGVAGKNWRLSVEAFNAFNDRHIETINERGLKGESVGRSVTANLTYSPK